MGHKFNQNGGCMLCGADESGENAKLSCDDVIAIDERRDKIRALKVKRAIHIYESAKVHHAAKLAAEIEAAAEANKVKKQMASDLLAYQDTTRAKKALEAEDGAIVARLKNMWAGDGTTRVSDRVAEVGDRMDKRFMELIALVDKLTKQVEEAEAAKKKLTPPSEEQLLKHLERQPTPMGNALNAMYRQFERPRYDARFEPITDEA